GARLLDALERHAASIGLEHLRLVLRSGERLEDYYSRRGWREIGRHPGALRIAEGDDRDEVAMMLDLSAG
ncbi:MAG: GNAT family N-acetyltransferase, partial [Actinomycetota bacterium]